MRIITVSHAHLPCHGVLGTIKVDIYKERGRVHGMQLAHNKWQALLLSAKRRLSYACNYRHPVSPTACQDISSTSVSLAQNRADHRVGG